MLNVHSFVFNAFQENTYIVYDEKGLCAIFDPGMSNHEEEATFASFVEQNNLKPIALYNTHCHIDHVLGNHFIFEKYGLIPQFHEGEVPVIVAVQNMAPMYGFRYETSPIPETFFRGKPSSRDRKTYPSYLVCSGTFTSTPVFLFRSGWFRDRRGRAFSQ